MKGPLQESALLLSTIKCVNAKVPDINCVSFVVWQLRVKVRDIWKTDTECSSKMYSENTISCQLN